MTTCPHAVAACHPSISHSFGWSFSSSVGWKVWSWRRLGHWEGAISNFMKTDMCCLFPVEFRRLKKPATYECQTNEPSNERLNERIVRPESWNHYKSTLFSLNTLRIIGDSSVFLISPLLLHISVLQKRKKMVTTRGKASGESRYCSD